MNIEEHSGVTSRKGNSYFMGIIRRILEGEEQENRETQKERDGTMRR